MYGSAEHQCVDTIINLIRGNHRFRPITLEDEGQLLQGIDYKRAFLLVKGSYKAKDMVIGVLLDYGPATSNQSNSGVSILYRILCKPPTRAVFTRETDDNQVTKRIGPHPEEMVGDLDIDMKFLIHTHEPSKIKALLEQGSFREYLLNNAGAIARLELTPERIELERIFIPDQVNEEMIQKDLDELSEAVASLTSIGDKLL